VFDIRTWKQLSVLDHSSYFCSSNTNKLCVSPNSQYAVVGSKNGAVVVFDIKKSKLVEVYEEHITPVVACEWQPRGSTFATVDTTGGLYVWQD